MADLDRIVTVNITRQAGVPSQAGFNGILIASEFLMGSWTNAWGATERVRIYTSLAAMVADGCPVASYAYLAAAAIFSQSPCVTQVFIGRKLTGGDGSENWTVALTAMAAVSATLAAWYAVVCSERTGSNQQLIAAWVEANKKICILASADTTIPTATTTDIAAYCQTSTFTRTTVIYHPLATGVWTTDVVPDAAWMGAAMPYTPGSITLAFKTLAGVPAYVLSGAQVAFVLGKNGNIYTAIAGVNVTQMGSVGSGEYFDIIWGIDWLQSQIQSNIYSAIIGQPKIPFTDNGIDIIVSQLRAALQTGVVNGLLASFTVTAPLAANVPTSSKQTRSLPSVAFTAKLAGAIHSTTIAGTVTY